jgi:hypothetical protein
MEHHIKLSTGDNVAMRGESNSVMINTRSVRLRYTFSVLQMCIGSSRFTTGNMCIVTHAVPSVHKCSVLQMCIGSYPGSQKGTRVL